MKINGYEVEFPPEYSDLRDKLQQVTAENIMLRDAVALGDNTVNSQRQQLALVTAERDDFHRMYDLTEDELQTTIDQREKANDRIKELETFIKATFPDYDYPAATAELNPVDATKQESEEK